MFLWRNGNVLLLISKSRFNIRAFFTLKIKRAKLKMLPFLCWSRNWVTFNMKNATRQKILLLLSSGVVLGLSRSPKNYFKILENLPLAWKEINKNRLYRIVREFYNEKLVDYKEDKENFVKIVLTKEGQKKALKFKIDEMEIKKSPKWDKEWRVVIFDIPERFKKAREALREKLKDLGFIKLQESVFVFPHECEDEIDFIVEVFLIRPFVRFMRVKSFTNEEQIRLKFNLF
mgnify:FL=1